MKYCTVQIIEGNDDSNERFRWTYYLGPDAGGCDVQEWRWDAQDKCFRWESAGMATDIPDAPRNIPAVIARLQRAQAGGDQSGAARTWLEEIEQGGA